jgi:hypothetical protein
MIHSLFANASFLEASAAFSTAFATACSMACSTAVSAFAAASMAFAEVSMAFAEAISAFSKAFLISSFPHFLRRGLPGLADFPGHAFHDKAHGLLHVPFFFQYVESFLNRFLAHDLTPWVDGT